MGILDFFHDKIFHLFEAFKDGACVSDIDTGKLVYANPAFRKLVGIAEDQDISEKFCYQVIEGMNSRCDFCKTELLNENKWYICRRKIPHIKRNVILREQLISWDGVLRRLMIMIDIEQPDKIEDILSTNIHIENTLLDCIGPLVRQTNSWEENSLQAIIEAIGKFCFADRAYIMELDTKKFIMHYSYEWCKSECLSTIDGFAKKGVHFSDFQQQIYAEQLSIVVTDIEELKGICPPEYDCQKSRGVRTLCVLPYHERGIIKGYIGIDNPRLDVGNFYFLKTLSLFVANQLNQYKLRQEQEYNMNHDALTGLFNRNAFINFMNHSKENANKSLGVIAANINGLGKFNKDFGQKYGDSIVKKVAETLKIAFSQDTIFRFGGDEFIIFCRGLTYAALVKQIEKAEAALKRAIYSGVTIAYTWTKEEADVDKLIHDATEAMILKKQRYYEGLHRDSRHNNLQLFENLQAALQQNQYKVYFQPKIDLRNETLSGIEALVRYQDPMYGVMSPATFIPLLEREGLIRHIDFFVLEQVCRTLASWRNRGYSVVPISLNFSRITLLESEVAESIEKIVDSYAVPHSCILIEITETAGNIEQEIFSSIATSLLEHGFGVSLDDFCSEYSCVSLLTIVPFQEVKFDKSMVDQLGKNNQQDLVCEKMMEMCELLGYYALAEGVETKEQLEILRGFSCKAVQGYFYSRPIPIAEFEKKYF